MKTLGIATSTLRRWASEFEPFLSLRRGVKRTYTVGGGETVSPPKSTPEIAKDIGLTKSSAFSNPQNEGLKTTTEIAHDIGLSKQTAERRMQVARNIVPEVKDAIRNTEIANSTTFIRSNTAINSRN